MGGFLRTPLNVMANLVGTGLALMAGVDATRKAPKRKKRPGYTGLTATTTVTDGLPVPSRQQHRRAEIQTARKYGKAIGRPWQEARRIIRFRVSRGIPL